jgi:glycosyltransferase involved in cell wall biosynthesis
MIRQRAPAGTSREGVAFLLDSAPTTWTSQEDRHLRLCEALVRRGVRPVLVFARALRPDIDARLRSSGADVEAIDYGAGPRHYYRELRRLVRTHGVTTAHVIFFDYFSAIPWIARLAGMPHVVYEMQNSGEFRATSWRKRLLQVRARAMTRPAARVIAISEFVKGQLASGGVPESKMVVRHLGVDIDRFRPDPQAREEWARRFSLGPGEVILSTVSYLRPFKNPQILVEACGELARRGVAARLFVAGDGEMLPDLKRLSNRLGVDGRIQWLGNVADPKALLQASDIFLLASVGEAFGLVLAEAMACGVPVVGSRSGSLMEVVADGRTGVLCTPLDARAFADAIERLVRDVPLRQHMAAEAIERVRKRFSLDMSVEKTLEIYEAVWSGG